MFFNFELYDQITKFNLNTFSESFVLYFEKFSHALTSKTAKIPFL